MVIDRAQALERLAGNEALLDMLVNKFINDNLNAVSDLQALLQSEQLEDAAKLVHSIKGAAGNLSMNELFAAAKDLEHSLRQNNLADEATLLQFNENMQAVLALKS